MDGTFINSDHEHILEDDQVYYDKENSEFENWVVIWDRIRNSAAIKMICLVTYGLYLLRKRSLHMSYSHMPTREQTIEREAARRNLFEFLNYTRKSRSLLRMKPETFAQLCNLMRTNGQLKDTRLASVEEQVAIFLYAVGHNQRNCSLQVTFRRSGETISRYFHKVLEAILSLEDQFLIKPDKSNVPPEIQNKRRYYPYFKDCIGAIDGTHVRVKVSNTNAPRYRGRKNRPTQNVLAACSFDLKFTYVLPGWEGTASDSRILKNALTREDNLHIPEGKYYLVDAGYMLTGGLITPYRGVRYHLKEYSSRGPENAQELFKLRHASLRNSIERAFGVVKKRFSMIASSTEPNYSFETQRDIVLACCILHNFLKGIDPDEELIAEVDRELVNRGPRLRRDIREEDSEEGKIVRDNIAAQMWNDYAQSLAHTE